MKGILLNKGLSLYQFDAILVNTLKEYRGANVVVNTFPWKKTDAVATDEEEEELPYCLDVPTDAVAKVLKEMRLTGTLTDRETQQLYNYKTVERCGIMPEVADGDFVMACCGMVAKPLTADKMYGLYRRYSDFSYVGSSTW